MLNNGFLLIENKSTETFIDSTHTFVVNEVSWMSDQHSDEYLYQQILYKVVNQPKLLISHIQRIYFTYGYKQTEQLFAALVDLLIVLDGKGYELSQRMISGARSLLSTQQMECLHHYMKHKDKHLLIENKYSIFTKGLIGVTTLMTEQKKESSEYDVLNIARDYIEYSQLDAAINTLEEGVVKHVEREDLQIELLELYKVTENISAFTRMHHKLMNENVDLFEGWQKLSDYFLRLNNAKE